MKIVIPGGTGQVGTFLTRTFLAEGHEVVVLSRQPAGTLGRHVYWDGATAAAWVAEVDGSDVVINLAGRSVNCRYNAENRRQIIGSRVLSTQAVGRAIAEAARPPCVWLQASTATIYAHRYDAGNDESTGLIGGTEPNLPDTWRFSLEVAKAWEHAAMDCKLPQTRTVLLRTSLTMSPDRSGVFDVLSGLTRKGLGGTIGNGRQYVSWIHDQDYVRAIRWLIDRPDLIGPINLTSPNPLPNAEFMRVLRQVWGVWFGPPAFEWMIELGTRIMSTESELVLKSRRVVPGKLLESGFEFEFPTWPEAAGDLCRHCSIQY